MACGRQRLGKYSKVVVVACCRIIEKIREVLGIIK